MLQNETRAINPRQVNFPQPLAFLYPWAQRGYYLSIHIKNVLMHVTTVKLFVRLNYLYAHLILKYSVFECGFVGSSWRSSLRSSTTTTTTERSCGHGKNSSKM